MRRAVLSLVAAAALSSCGETEREIERAAGTSTTTSPTGPQPPAGAVALEATLTGSAEVPDPGDPDGGGRAVVRIDLAKSEACYELSVTGIDPAQAAHVHQGAAGVAGGVLVTLTPPTSGAATGCVSADVNVLRAIVTAPEGYYVNVHNAAYPNGAVRGQLRRT